MTLTSDDHDFSIAQSNTQTLTLTAGAANANRLYWVFGSATGTSPGVTLGGVTIPLNIDFWTDLTISSANSTTFVNTKGTLDSSGKATAMIVGGPVGVQPGLIGLVLYHSYLVYDANAFYMASNPVTLLIAK